MKLEFSRPIFGKKKVQISNFIKIRPVAAELFHADLQTDWRTWRRLYSRVAILRKRLKRQYKNLYFFCEILQLLLLIFFLTSLDTLCEFFVKSLIIKIYLVKINIPKSKFHQIKIPNVLRYAY